MPAKGRNIKGRNIYIWSNIETYWSISGGAKGPFAAHLTVVITD